MFVTVNREKTCLGHGKGWVELHALLHYSIPAMKCQFNACVIPIILVTMLYIRLSDLRKTKNKDGALEKNVDYQFEFPRQFIVQKNALSLTQAPMVLESLNWSQTDI